MKKVENREVFESNYIHIDPLFFPFSQAIWRLLIINLRSLFFERLSVTHRIVSLHGYIF